MIVFIQCYVMNLNMNQRFGNDEIQYAANHERCCP